jgi:hypothetical protein
VSELDALDPVAEQVKLSTGTAVLIEDLKARQFFKLLRIITHGALPALTDTDIFRTGGDLDAAEFGGRLLSVMLLAIPDAEAETIDFIRSMCKPVGLIEGRALNKADTERNAYLWGTLNAELDNPELDDLVTIVEAIVRRESADIQALGKRLMGMFRLAEKTGQVPPSPTSQTSNSLEDSLSLSISSPLSTDGPTTTSADSASDASASASPPSDAAASTKSGNASSE